MKFSNGCWLQKEGTECLTPAEVYFTKIKENEVQLCAPTHKINHRGDTLGGANITVKISAPMPEVIRVKAYHYAGVQKKAPEFELNIDETAALDAEETEDKVIVRSGSLRLEINKEDWLMSYYRGDELITKSGRRDLAYMKTDWKGIAYDDGLEHDTYMRQQLSLGVGELIYGFGEKFSPFVKNGQTVQIWNKDSGTSTEDSYKSIPFYVSNNGYGIFVNNSGNV